MNEIQYYLNKGINKNFVCSKDCPSGECRIPIMGGMHNRFQTYEEYTLVYDEDTLVAYISKRCVPKGVEITNRKYWQPMNVSGYADDNIIVLADRDEYGQTISYNLATAVESIAEVSRNPGVLLSFFSTEDGAHWELWQYNALNTDDWSDLSQWRSIYNTQNKFVGWYNSLEDLQKIYVGTFPGHYAIVGEDLSSITVYEGRKTGWYPLDVNLYQEALNELIRNIDEGSIYLTNEQKGKFKAFMCGFNEEECPCGGNSGSGSGEGSSEGTTHVEIYENPYDDAEIRQLISDVQSRLNNLILITDDDVRSTVSSMIKSMEHFIDTFGWNEMFKDSGWSEEMKAYIQQVGFTDKQNNQVSWSEFYQDFQTLSEVVRNIKIAEDSGEEINYEVIEGMIRTAIENNQTLNTISSKWAITDDGENVLRWAVSQLQTVAGEDHSLADMFAAVRSENTQAIADLNLDAKLDAAKVELTTSINGVRDSLSGYIAKSELDNTSSTIYSKLDDRYATIQTAVTKDANGKVTSSITFGADNVLLNEDGSGYLAGGNINWNTAGDTTLNGEINAESGTIGGWTIDENSLSSKFLDENIDAGHSNENKISLNSYDPSIKLSNTYTSYIVDDEEPGIGFILHKTTKYVNIEADNENNFVGIILGQQRVGRNGSGPSSSVQLSPSGIQINTTTITGGYDSTYTEGIPISLNADGSGWLANGNFKWTEDGQISIIGQNEENQEISAAQFNKDGSGSLANGNLSWDKDGKLSLSINAPQTLNGVVPALRVDGLARFGSADGNPPAYNINNPVMCQIYGLTCIYHKWFDQTDSDRDGAIYLDPNAIIGDGINAIKGRISCGAYSANVIDLEGSLNLNYSSINIKDSTTHTEHSGYTGTINEAKFVNGICVGISMD